MPLFAIADANTGCFSGPKSCSSRRPAERAERLLSSRSERCVAARRRRASGGDPVGAGDAFTAVLAIELMRGSPLAAMAARANRYAAYVASQPGAMPKVPPSCASSLRPARAMTGNAQPMSETRWR